MLHYGVSTLNNVIILSSELPESPVEMGNAISQNRSMQFRDESVKIEWGSDAVRYDYKNFCFKQFFWPRKEKLAVFAQICTSKFEHYNSFISFNHM